jgi:hypothetical protein
MFREKGLDELISKWYPNLPLKESIVLKIVVYTYETIHPHTGEIVARISAYFPELFRNEQEIKNTIALLVSKKILSSKISHFTAINPDGTEHSRGPDDEFLDVQNDFGKEAFDLIYEIH